MAGSCTVQAPDSKINFRNLMGGTLARLWTESAALQLRRQDAEAWPEPWRRMAASRSTT